MKSKLYVGTYTRSETGGKAEAEGLLVYQFDDETGALERVRAVDAGQDPTFLTATSDDGYLFAANHLDEGTISGFRVLADGGLEFINRQPVHGADTCYISMDPGERWLLTASYTSGNFTVNPLDADMRIQPASDVVRNEGQGPNAERQDAAHAHSIRCSPNGKYIFGADLGTDRVCVFRLDERTGKLIPHTTFRTHSGAGPRHLDHSRDGRFVYIANELDSNVTACTWDAERGVLQEIQSLSTLRPGYQRENSVADIHVSPSGEYLYVSNRGENSLAVYHIDVANGHLRYDSSYDCGGNWPRNFVIHPKGLFLLVANQYSNNIVVLRIGENGRLTPTGVEVQEHAPVCLVFAGTA